MKENANNEYMAILGALGAHIEANKSNLVFANYEIERLQKQLAEAHREIAELKGEN